MKAFLLSFTTERSDGEYHYYLVYAEDIDSAYELLKLEYNSTKIYDIENCTIMPITHNK
jgi:hypothetical protein